MTDDNVILLKGQLLVKTTLRLIVVVVIPADVLANLKLGREPKNVLCLGCGDKERSITKGELVLEALGFLKCILRTWTSVFRSVLE